MAKLLPDRRNAALSFGRYGPLGGGLRSGGPSIPVISVNGGAVTCFTRGGVEYTQIIFRDEWSLSVSGTALTGQRTCIGAGGASTGSGFNRGGGAAGKCREDHPVLATLAPGFYTGTIGLGGEPGMPGDDSVVMRDGTEILRMRGGGLGGSGAGAGGNGGNGGGAGGNGGGAGGNTGSRLGGVGEQNNGGASGGPDITPGGGGGAGGPGLPGGPASGVGGNGGPGLDLLWAEPPLHVGGGGGAGGTATPGTATHGGSSGTSATVPLDADWSGGAGGSRTNAVAQARGGNGFLILVFARDRAIILPQLG